MEPVTYRLRAPLGWLIVAVCGIMGLGCAIFHVLTIMLQSSGLFSAGSAPAYSQALSAVAAIAGVATALGAAFPSAVVSPGRVVFEDDGVLFDTAGAQGFVAWENVAAAAIVPGFAGRYLAVRLHDPEAYAETSCRACGMHRYRHPSVSFGAPGHLLASLPSVRRVIDLLVTATGHSPLPNDLTERARMAWNERNFGFHVLIWKSVFPDAEEAVIGLAFGHRPANRRMTTPSILSPS